MTTTAPPTGPAHGPRAGSAHGRRRAGPAAVVPGPAGRAGWRRRAGALFAPAPPRPVTAGGVLAGILLALACAGYSLSRVGGPGPFDSVWAEDGANFLTDAYGLPFGETILRPVNGYYLVVPRLLSGLARLAPVAAGPAVLTVAAALVSGGLAVLVYHASATVLGSPPVRLVAAAWMVAAPLAESPRSFGPTMVASLQFVEVYALFWLLLWTPSRRGTRMLQVAAVTGIVASTFLAVLLLPLALLRLWVTRDRWALTLVGLLAGGAAFQSSALVLGLTTRANISHPRFDAWWAVGHYVDWALPYGLAGEWLMRDPGFSQPSVFTGTGGPWYWTSVVLAWLVVLAAVVAAARGLSHVDWWAAGVAGGGSLAVLAGEILVQGRLELRYVYPPGLLAVVALLALVRPGRSRLPFVGLVLVLAVAAGTNYRLATTRSGSLPWRQQVERSTAICVEEPQTPFVVTYTTPEWFVVLPCDRLR